MPDIRIFPATSCISVTGSVVMQGSGSTTVPSIFTVAGCAGALLTVTDDLSTSVFSANTIAGLPVIEAYSNNCVNIGQYNGHKLTVTCTSIVGGSSNVVIEATTNLLSSGSFIGGGAKNCITLLGCASYVAGNSSIVGGHKNCICANCSFIGGGCGNTLPDQGACWSAIVMGRDNTSSAAYAFMGAGSQNSISSYNGYSTITNGRGNCAGCSWGTFIGNGWFNYAGRSTTRSYYSVILSGFCNSTEGAWANFIGNGSRNCICCTNSNYAFIGNGCCNLVAGLYGVVVGGQGNCACAWQSGILSGHANLISSSGCYSAILNGYANYITGKYSGIIGYTNTVSNNYAFSAGAGNTVSGIYSAAIGANLNATSACYLYVNNLCNVSGGTSDCRVKHSICSLDLTLDQITNLKPTSFIYKGDCSNFRRYGFLAQEVCQYIPEIITHHPIDKIDPEGNVGGKIEGDPVLQFEKDAIYSSYVNAFKELKAKIESLEERVRVLESR